MKKGAAIGSLWSSVFARQIDRVVGEPEGLPHLKTFGRDLLHEPLGERDFIQQPIGPGGIRYVFCAVGAGNARVQSEALPMLGTGSGYFDREISLSWRSLLLVFWVAAAAATRLGPRQ
jgi:hypothetical protein